MNHVRMDRRKLLGGALVAGSALWSGEARSAPRPPFTTERAETSLLVKAMNGSAVLRYVRRRAQDDVSTGVAGACYTHPVYTPAGELVTDLAPADLPQLRGVFCGWRGVRGDKSGDWWGGAEKTPATGGLIVNREATVAETGKRTALRLVNSWRADGASVLEEVLTITVGVAPSSYVLDYDYQFTTPTSTPVVLAPNPLGGLCYRAMPGGSLVISGPNGGLDLPDAVPNQASTNWPASPWYDLTYTTSDGTASGLALIDHPKNPRSTWHVSRALHLLNPCIVANAPFTISAASPLRLRYRLVPHDGPVQPQEINKLRESFSS